MAIEKITKRMVDALRATAQDTFTWDTDVRGFGIKVTPAGRKSYVIQYRLPGRGRRGNAKRLVLADHGLLTPDEARTRAKQELGKVAQGLDPAAERSARKQAANIREFGEAFLTEIEARRKESTAIEYRRLWRKHVLPSMGAKPVSGVTPIDCRRLHRAMRDTPFLANRVAAMLGAFFSFARKEGIMASHENPAHGVEFYPEPPRDRFLSPEEFRRLGEALSRAERTGLPPAPQHRRKAANERTRKHIPKSAADPIRANPFSVAAIRLLALTGCRENEVLSLRWDAVDLEHGYLRFADTKTGRNARPLGTGAAMVIESLPRIEGNPYVFPGAKESDHLKELKRTWYAVLHAAKLEGVRLHDLRHSYASVPASSGESMLVLRDLLGHRRVATTERYAHLGDDPVKNAADRTSQSIAQMLASGQEIRGVKRPSAKR